MSDLVTHTALPTRISFKRRRSLTTNQGVIRALSRSTTFGGSETSDASRYELNTSMELHRLTILTEPTDETGEVEYWIGDVPEFEGMWGFELFDYCKAALAHFLFADEVGAQVARGAMFKTLKDVVAVSVMPEQPS